MVVAGGGKLLPKKRAPWEAGVRFAVTGYMCCSASLLVCNKVAVTYLPAPSFVLLCQLVATAVAVRTAAALGHIELEPITWALVSKFVVVPLAFVGAIFTNIKTLQYANVETFIVFRASTPLLISLADWLWLGPSTTNKQTNSRCTESKTLSSIFQQRKGRVAATWLRRIGCSLLSVLLVRFPFFLFCQGASCPRGAAWAAWSGCCSARSCT